MSQISRRTLIKASAATAAAAAVAAPGVASAEMMESPKEHPGYPAAKESAAIFPENPLPESDLSLTGSFNLGKSQLNEGESITAFRWGVVRPVVKGGRLSMTISLRSTFRGLRKCRIPRLVSAIRWFVSPT